VACFSSSFVLDLDRGATSRLYCEKRRHPT
jgi:hypothetical protein